jgi:hypothetical protein
MNSTTAVRQELWPQQQRHCLASLRAPRKFSAPVGVVSRLNKKNESLDTSPHDSFLHNARVTIYVFAIGYMPTIITVIYAH